MKRMLIVLAVFAAVAGSEALAGQRSYYRSGYRSSSRPVRTYNYGYNSGYSYGRSQGPLGQLMELERAKNAWLRQTFFGR